MPREKITILTPQIIQAFHEDYNPIPDANGCFNWLKGNNELGYGRIQICVNGVMQAYYAHRISYMIHNNLTELFREFVLHRCPNGDNPFCVNPAHLYLGTQYENMKRMTELGHRIQGITHPSSKITDDDVRQMRKDYRSGHYKQKELADMYGISVANVSLIVNYKAWTHVKG